MVGKKRSRITKDILPESPVKVIESTTKPSISTPITPKNQNKLTTEEQKVKKICQILDHYYPNPPIPLNHTNGFTFLVAVILSAQTTDGKVNEVTKILFQKADNPEKMSQLSVNEVESIIKPVGLAPRKAKSIVEMSKQLIDRFQSQVPNTYEDLESLPGVGHKTASVIMSQLFGVSSFAVDTHVHRLALRWGLSKEQTNVDKVQRDLYQCIPQEYWDKMHLQMIYFGREYCPAKNHKPSECPICSWISTKDYTIVDTDTHELLGSYSPTKRAKGLVYYSDRMNELHQAPELAKYSTSPIKIKFEEDHTNNNTNNHNNIDVKVEFTQFQLKEEHAEKEDKDIVQSTNLFETINSEENINQSDLQPMNPPKRKKTTNIQTNQRKTRSSYFL